MLKYKSLTKYLFVAPYTTMQRLILTFNCRFSDNVPDTRLGVASALYD